MAEIPTKNKMTMDRRGTSFLVPLGISLVLIALVVGWVSMSAATRDSSSVKDVMSRPNAPSGRTP